jgi:BolA family transcriptional regulator, general stress-responsive regulator
MSRQERIASRLKEVFHPLELAVIDESHQHHGHSGWREGGETHYRVRIVADAFSGATRIARHRMVTDALADELAGGLHALAIEPRAPGE